MTDDLTNADRLWILGAFATLAVGTVHTQQFISDVGNAPTIAELFLLNGIGAGAIVIALTIPKLRLLAAIGGIGLSMGALISLAIARFGDNGIFDYREPELLRGPVVVAILAEVAAVGLLYAYVVSDRDDASSSSA